MSRILLGDKLVTKYQEGHKKFLLLKKKGVSDYDMPVLAKYFNPYEPGTWYVLDAIKDSNDWKFFCYVEMGNRQSFEYVLLSDLRMYSDIERDMSLATRTLHEALVNDNYMRG